MMDYLLNPIFLAGALLLMLPTSFGIYVIYKYIKNLKIKKQPTNYRQFIQSEMVEQGGVNQYQNVIRERLSNVEVSFNPEIKVKLDDRNTLKILVDKYTTGEMDIHFVEIYNFQPSYVPHDYSDRELSEKAKYIVYTMTSRLDGCKYQICNVNDPNKWFDYYAEALYLLPQLSEFEPYFNFDEPIPHMLYEDYLNNRELYTKQFIERWWQRVQNQAAELKTVEGRKNKIDKHVMELLTYKEFISDNNLQLINDLIIEVNLETIKKAEKPLPEFDQTKEHELLNTLNNCKGNAENEHFAYIELQNFYYKYRNNDPKYVELCKKYCKKDIELLPKVDKDYINSQVSIIKQLMVYHDSATKINDREKIEDTKRNGFIGRIPAFKRLSIIYENEKDFESAIKYCDAEISHYLSHGYTQDSNMIKDISKRREKLIAKQNKFLENIKK